MSAICGMYDLDQGAAETKQQGMCVMAALKHYPYDAIRTWHRENIFLGCHAQWITPESIGERLPRYDEEFRLAITADAIIDNRQQLFEQLSIPYTSRKHMTDSELIVQAYLHWGTEAPNYLIGDFAFVVWDEREQLLFGAADFSGSRTLYLYRDAKRVVFCTTIEPLLQLPYVAKDINELWFAEFMSIPGMVDTTDIFSTPYLKIEQLPPSHIMTVRNGKVQFSRYSTISSGEQLKLRSDEDYEEAFKAVFEEAVTARTRSAGGVGAQLSGGMDSGSVVSFAAKALGSANQRLHTFSYVPEDHFTDWTPPGYAADERPYIRATVGYVGNITDHYLNMAGSSPLTDLDDSLELMETPYKYFENLFWLKGIHEHAHHQGIKVLLSGARGNYSISWGSWSMTMNYYASLFKRLRWGRLNRELDCYCQNYHTGKSIVLPMIVKKAFPFIARSSSSHTSSYTLTQPLINTSFAQKTNVYARLQEQGIDLTGSGAGSVSEARKKHFEQLFHWHKSGAATTKLSLRYSLWNRDPTNDLRVIRFCLSLPEEQYVVGGLQRSLIRRATKSLLPDQVRLNQQIRGIQGADVIHRMASRWGHFLKELHQLVEDPIASEMFNRESLKLAIAAMGSEPRPELVFQDEFRMLTRSLIIYRFLRRLS